MVAVRDIHKTFFSAAAPRRFATSALEGISFDVHAGEVVSLLGASGCGKTTLLRIIAGLLVPTRGSVVVRGEPVRAPRRDLCMVFQAASLLPWRTVLSNVSFPLEIDGMARPERERIARRYIDIVGLGGYEHRFPHELSGGMQQRVGIARGLVRKPLVLLMDEPFGALDAQTREGLQDDFSAICSELNTTVVLVTHSIEEALVLSKRIVVLTSRPGVIRRVVAPVFPPDVARRDVRGTPEFGAYAREVRDLLRGAEKAR